MLKKHLCSTSTQNKAYKALCLGVLKIIMCIVNAKNILGIPFKICKFTCTNIPRFYNQIMGPCNKTWNFDKF
jgi:hypothetical protein